MHTKIEMSLHVCRFVFAVHTHINTQAYTHTHTVNVPGDVFAPKPAHTADRTEGNKRNKSALTKQSHTAFCQFLQSMLMCIQCPRLCSVLETNLP